jgi:23S rRNA pseudouridine1911/1915/1917 synthase
MDAGATSHIITGELDAMRLDRALVALQPDLSRTRVQSLIEAGQVRLNGKAVRPGTVVRPGDRIDLDIPAPVAAEPQPEAIALEILYEDDDVVVINKPAGMNVHPGAGHPAGTVVNALLHHCGHLSSVGGVMRPGIVHRLDKDTSGVMVATKNDLAHRHLAIQFERHTIERAYVAIAWEPFRFKQGSFRSTIERDPRNRLRMTGKTGSGRPAVTHYTVEAETPHFSKLRCTLETGRTHQIRVHCSENGHPLVGDVLYGKGRSVSPKMGANLQNAVRAFPRQALHASTLGFTARDGNSLRFETPLPADMAELWRLIATEDLP